MVTTVTLAEEYQAQGFVHVPAFFVGRVLQQLIAEVDRVTATEPTPRGPWLGPWLDEAEYRRRPVTLTTIHHLHLLSPYWREMMTSDSIRALMGSLVGCDDVELCRATIITKPPETGAPFPLHQDGAYIDMAPHYVQAVVYLDDMTEENGPIRFLAGSHRQGLLPHSTEGKRHLPLDTYSLEQATPILAKAGDIVCFSPWAVHGSDRNRSQQIRRTVRLGYAGHGEIDMIKVRYACGHEGMVSISGDAVPRCHCGEQQIVQTSAPAPRFRGACSGPYAETKAVEPAIVNVATAGPLRLKPQE